MTEYLCMSAQVCILSRQLFFVCLGPFVLRGITAIIKREINIIFNFSLRFFFSCRISSEYLSLKCFKLW